MIFATLILLQVAASGPVELQQRVDKLVSTCSAADVVQLTAESDKQVAMKFIRPAVAPSKSDSDKFDCVLAGMKAMPDIQFGFLGNLPEPEAK